MHAKNVLPACLGAAILCTGARVDDPNDLYVALNHVQLFSALGLPAPGEPGGPLTSLENGRVLYQVTQSDAPAVRQLSIAVCASVEKAKATFRAMEAIYPTAPSPDPTNPPGEDFAWWQSASGSAQVLVRRANVVWRLSPARACADVLATARTIDGFIRDDRQIAPKGTFTETPEIASVGVPKTAQKNARITITPEFRGLGDRAALRVAVVAPADSSSRTETTLEGKSRPQVVVRGARGDGLDDTVRPRAPTEDGRFIVHVPDKTGPIKLTMIVATPDNVVVTKDFTINVTE